jgi:hypothetical protein
MKGGRGGERQRERERGIMETHKHPGYITDLLKKGLLGAEALKGAGVATAGEVWTQAGVDTAGEGLGEQLHSVCPVTE